MIDTPPNLPNPPEPKPGKPKPRRRFGLVWLESALFMLVSLLALTALLAASPLGTRMLAVAAERLSLGALQLGRVEGTLWGELVVHELRFSNAHLALSLDRATLSWRPSALLAGELNIDRLELGRLTLKLAPSKAPLALPTALTLPLSVTLRQATLASLNVNGQPMLGHVALSLDSDGRYHKLVLDQLAAPWFDGHGELRLDGVRPFRLGGTLALTGETDDATWRVDATLAKQLDDISLIGGGRGGPSDLPPFSADFDLRLNPFAATPYGILREGRLETASVDLHVLSPRLPRTALNLSLSAAPQGAAHVSTRFALTNPLAGPLAAGRLPLGKLDALLTLDAQHAYFDRFIAGLAGGQLVVAGDVGPKILAVDATLDKVNLAELDGPAWPLSGHLRVTGSPAVPHALGQLHASGLLADIDANMTGSEQDRKLSLRRLDLHSANGTLAMAGQLGLAGHRDFIATGQLSHFDPASLSVLAGRAIPAGDINGNLKVSGSATPTPQASLALHLADSRFHGQPLGGDAALAWQGERISGVRVDLALGANRLKASGALGKGDDALLLDVALPSLGDLGNGFAGRVDGKLKLAGAMAHPTIEGNARADSLRLPGEVAIAHGNLFTRLDASAGRPADSPVSLRLDVQGLKVATLSLDNGRLTLAGSRAQHAAELSAQGDLDGCHVDLSMKAGGSFDTAGWHGRVDQFDSGGDFPARLNVPARLALSGAGGSLDGFDAVALGTQLTVSHAEWMGSRFAAVGDIRELALAKWLDRMPDIKHRIATDLVMAAHFDLHGDDHLAGSLWLERQSGDLSLLVDDPAVKPMPLKLSAARLNLDMAADRATVGLDLKSAAFGSANGRLTTRFERTDSGWRPANGAPLEGSLRADMPALNWVGPLLGPTAAVNGRLSAELTAGGVVGAPTWFGRLKLDDFALRLPELGANWHDGKLEATLDGDTAQLSTFLLKAGDGQASAAGRMSLHDSGAEGALTVTFSQFGALTRPDRKLIVSGESTLALQGQRLSLTGRLKADEGLIELPKRNAPVLGDDVVVKGAVARTKTASKAPPVNLSFDLDLGDHFVFKGQGVDTKLTGSVRVSASPTQRLGATGALKVDDGRYIAYGQNLAISRGIVTFQGPLDNPALDILAERKNLPLVVGVKIVGTAQAPRVSLTSDQAMPDSEKLSWLVLGHGSTSTTGRGDADVLLAAADALFSAGQSVSLRQQLAGSLGLDDISVGRSTAYGVANDTGAGNGILPGSTTGLASTTNPALATRVVTLGKRLSDRAYISYEQSLDTVGYAVKLTYQLTRRVSVALSAGQNSAVDVLYSWLFD